MKVVVTGSTGLIGSAVVPALRVAGHRVVRLVRSDPGSDPDVHRWDADRGVVPAGAVEGADAVVHLAGETIAALRWSEAKKARIRDSRVAGTRALAEALARSARPPRVLVSASATGFYGSRGAERLGEDAPAGAGFLAGVCRDWEAATEPAARRGIRVANARFGLVLSARGGVLPALLRPFRLGVGGVVGDGEQYVSWITLDDAVAAVLHVLGSEALSGPVNVVAPEPVTNAALTRALGRVLARPTVLPFPAFAARLLLGEVADEMLLASVRAVPARLAATGFAFRDPELEPALRRLLGRAPEPR